MEEKISQAVRERFETKISFLQVISLFIVAAIIGCGSSNTTLISSLEKKTVERGNLTVTVSATGTVEPVEIVDIGAQIVGQILELGTDINQKTIDYGSIVEQGAVLAKIDDRLYQAEEQLAAANLKRAEADLKRSQASLFIAEREWKRAQTIGDSKALSQSNLDTYRSNYELALADVLSAQAAILQAEATHSRAVLNVQFCTIRSPVRGTIVDKRVNIGQTVVSSFNSPSLFLLAKDLTRIQVWVSVNEADISALHPDQSVTFTVDAYAGETFKGKVNKIRLNASMVQNVVSYIVEVDTENIDGKLLPYLTANVQFEIGNVTNSLLVPNAALRFIPAGELTSGLDKSKKYVFVISNSELSPIQVTPGITNGVMTEVRSEQLTEGMEVATGYNQSKNTNSKDTVNPFIPKLNPGRINR